MDPLMFAGLVGFLLIGFPVAFSLAALGLAFGVLGVQLGFFVPDFLASLRPRGESAARPTAIAEP